MQAPEQDAENTRIDAKDLTEVLRTTSAIDCPGCHDQPHYDHVHSADELPRTRRTDNHVVRHGYAVGFAGNTGLPQTWVFFADLEPAVVFGRAARMSGSDISHYSVTEAARENRWTEHLHRDVVTLHLKHDSQLRDHVTERPILERWAEGCRPDSAYYEGPLPR